MYLLAVDPGAKTGMAMFVDGKLLFARTVRPDDREKCDCVRADVLVIEMPEIYAGGKARPRDILKLATLVGRYQERFDAHEEHLVHPRDWKGSVDGDIMTARIRASLTPEEARICAGADHNALDAVGIGKWALRQPWMRGR